ncbi:MAG: ABC transporter ATP-binding protein [Candidatus Aenigmarchaeota archaeon]|nr:ABC transporter ATP-binding protein [Candidatus Aenigmarchaeota archaeon]
MDKEIIKVENLWFRYDSSWVLKDISLSIDEGEFVGIVGPTGSGKTTLVKHFNGLLKPTKGRVLINGYDTRKHKASFISRFVGYVSQNPDHQIFSQTVYEELAFGPKNFGIKDVERRVREVAKLFKLTGKLNSSPFSMSMGEKELLAIASILSFDPKVIILDEPTIGQDFVSYLELVKLLKKLNQRGKTIILISHNVDMLAECTNKIVAILNGRKLFEGSTDVFFEKKSVLKKLELPVPHKMKLVKTLRFKERLLDLDEILEWFRE